MEINHESAKNDYGVALGGVRGPWATFRLQTTTTVTTSSLQTTRKYHGRDHTVMDLSDVGGSYSRDEGVKRIKRQRPEQPRQRSLLSV